MFYEYDLTVPAGTAATSPATTRAILTRGHVTAVHVMFPEGCAGLVRTAADRGASQIWPSNPDDFFKGDDLVIPWREDYPLDDEPLEFILKGWSPVARFAHTVTWRFEVISLDRAQEAAAAPGLLRRLGEAILGRA